MTSKSAVTVFAGLTSKPVAMVFSSLASKLVVTVSSGLASKPVVTVFAGLTSKLVAMVFSSLASKLVATVSPGLTSKPVVGFLVEPQNQGRRFLPVWPQTRWLCISRFWPQNWQLWFGDLGHKITVMVSWFGPQNHVGYDFLIALQNRWDDEDDVGHTSKSSGLLHLEASQARVFQSSLKTGRGMMVGGTRGVITEVVMSCI
ncbi:hypothetical protein [Amphritea sp.]|uniref:hypothetical protein n=1 Tax=Amphritea sp. TaxID=1872502 RepID=UPI003D0CBCB9